MCIDKRKVAQALAVLAAVFGLATVTSASQTTSLDTNAGLQAQAGAGAATRLVMPRDGERRIQNQPAKSETKPASVTTRIFKDFKPGTCRPASPLRPSSSWAPRGETAISFCRS